MTTEATVRTFHGDTFPADCCEHCRSRRTESVALSARARLLKAAIVSDEPRAVVTFHAMLLLGMMEGRGMV